MQVSPAQVIIAITILYPVGFVIGLITVARMVSRLNKKGPLQ